VAARRATSTRTWTFPRTCLLRIRSPAFPVPAEQSPDRAGPGRPKPQQVEAALRPRYGARLCMVRSHWTRRQIDGVIGRLRAAWHDRMIYRCGESTAEDGQAAVTVELTRVLPAVRLMITRANIDNSAGSLGASTDRGRSRHSSAGLAWTDPAAQVLYGRYRAVAARRDLSGPARVGLGVDRAERRCRHRTVTRCRESVIKARHRRHLHHRTSMA
jgi:hypothetical protein